MVEQTLYRKYRPKTFDEVQGQDVIVKTLKNQIKHGTNVQAYLFCGTRGTGKTSVAKIFARAINCENQTDGNPCNECDTCKAIFNETNPDSILLTRFIHLHQKHSMLFLKLLKNHHHM